MQRGIRASQATGNVRLSLHQTGPPLAPPIRQPAVALQVRVESQSAQTFQRGTTDTNGLILHRGVKPFRYCICSFLRIFNLCPEANRWSVQEYVCQSSKRSYCASTSTIPMPVLPATPRTITV